MWAAATSTTSPTLSPPIQPPHVPRHFRTCKAPPHSTVEPPPTPSSPASSKPSLFARETRAQTPPPHHLHGLASAVDSCGCPFLARQIHARVLKRGFFGARAFLEARLLAAYARLSRLDLARHLFDAMPQRTIYAWLALVTAFADRGLFGEALLLFRELLAEAAELEFFVFPVVFKACGGGLGSVELGEELHGFVIKKGFCSNLYVGNALIDMYGKCGFVEEATKVFDGMPVRDCVSWNSIISGCASNGLVFQAMEFLERMRRSTDVKPNLVSWSAAIGGFSQNEYDEEAIDLLGQMIKSGISPNAQTLASVLPVCGRLELLDVGKEIHGYIVRNGLASNSYIINGLIDVYRRCGNMITAKELFLRFSVRNLVSYNTMIVGYCENGELELAKELFDRMELDGVKRDNISWNSMISGLVDNERFDEALNMFRYMQMVEGIEADSFNLGSILAACAALGALRQGKEIHSYAIARGLHVNPFVGAALVEMYSQCNDLSGANLAFDCIVDKNTVTWNVLISAYAQAGNLNYSLELLSMMRESGFDPNIYTWNGLIAGCMENGQNEFGLQIFGELLSENLRPDIYTIGMIIPICSRSVSLDRGKQVHAYSIRCGYDSDVHIGSALVDLYSKCGVIKLGIFTFDRILRHNLVSYNTMLVGYSMHGLREETLSLFNQLIENRIKPDAITFLSVLSSCVHGGVVEEGQFYFNLMKFYGIKPDLKHYTCMVDLFSRSGRLNEAYDLIQNMPMKPDSVVWGSLLSGCVTHCNTELGEIVANRLIELEGDNVANYVLLANLYAIAGKRDELVRTRHTIKDKGMRKSPGCSWIEEAALNLL
ncbi:Pentatricopeptide repeat-containing protein [Ananas comosus]|uniref:Pentatricopeptide repeat-containing protein n=1 Tax=Ananas comosus TaxID=4615 RepID=A0A199VEJ8_ANACO|nr:Pentatricopeptide repeat-containing protein [Ananas comosus]